MKNKKQPVSLTRAGALMSFALFIAMSFLDAQPTRAQSQGDAVGYQSAQVKAAFLYRLPRFIRWQDGRKATHFCFDKNSDITATFELLVKAKSDVAKVSVLEEGDQGIACDVRFVGDEAVSSPAPNQLLVSDREDFASRGGMIELTRKGSRLGLNINLDSLKMGNLSASSQLLKLATVVGGD